MDTSVQKWVGKSVTFLGILITGASQLVPVVAPLLGLTVTAGDVTAIGSDAVGIVENVGTTIGLVITLWGRIRATTKATLLPA